MYNSFKEGIYTISSISTLLWLERVRQPIRTCPACQFRC